MVLAAGLLLTPLGALFGTLLVALSSWALGEALPDFPFLMMVGTVAGSLYAAPTTIAALPLAYVGMVRSAGARGWALPVIGLVSGACTMAGVVWFTRAASEPVLAVRAIAITLIGGLSGGACGLLFAPLVALLRRR